MSGWFSVKRGVTDHPIFHKRPDRLYVWMYLLETAAWQDTRQDANGRPVAVHRGQLLTSFRQLEAATGVPIKVVRGLIDQLRTEDAIGTDKGTGRLLITIRNYEKYQNPDNKRGTVEGTARAQQGHTKKTREQILPSEDASASPISDPEKVVDLSSPLAAVWAIGKAFLAKHGVEKPGPLIGNWLKTATASELLVAIEAADRARTEDPIPYITAALKPKRSSGGGTEVGEIRERDGVRRQYVGGVGWVVLHD
ncbi:hypothetical protein HOY34_11200 [Xinfangfangia sp. D13-10-4-6]|uniref:hypothetical protein n=1 Tax=Pseudogemmobacter hezensis TaxID=2737662 RepID=UPI001553F459|nr:hypothetical protein [Pseudogemmobacter hezensis]NPD15769.1 hypothetical protein [Pseudogemmobacter hezensis]